MSAQYRFLISFIADNEPQTIETFSDNDSVSDEEATYLVEQFVGKPATISDIRVTGIHHSRNPKVHPGHYQQPEG